MREANWCYRNQAWRLSLSDGDLWTGDTIWLATGCKLDVKQDPLLSEVMKEFPIQVTNNYQRHHRFFCFSFFFSFWGACHQESLHIFGTFSVTLRCHKMPLKSWLMKNNWHEGTIVKRCITTVLTSLHIEGGAHFRLCCWSLTEVRKSNH